jgi:hypothetical protein
MLAQLFPQIVDDTYRGQKLALWLFGLVLFMRIGISLNTLFNGRSVAVSADGIPLASYPPAAARTIVALMALLGLAKLALSVVCVLALVRYKSAVPFLFLLLLLEHLSRSLILRLLPIERTGSPPGTAVNLVLLLLLASGLALSLFGSGDADARG